MTNRLAITLLIYGMAQAVIFGAGLLALLWSPLKDNSAILLAAVVVLSLILAVPAAWKIAPLMRAKHQRTLAREDKLGAPYPN